MTNDEQKIVTASGVINAPAAEVFELIADPARQPAWDGNDNLQSAELGQRVTAVGDVFATTLTDGSVRDNYVVEFDDGHLIGWTPATAGEAPAGHRWRWEVEPIDDASSRVTHTYDWSGLTDPNRVERARSTTGEWLQRSIDRLTQVAEGADG